MTVSYSLHYNNINCNTLFVFSKESSKYRTVLKKKNHQNTRTLVSNYDINIIYYV